MELLAYESYHQHPVNKAFHSIGIPTIILCFINYTQLIKFHCCWNIPLLSWKSNGSSLIYGLLAFYLYQFGLRITLYMTLYFHGLLGIAWIWRTTRPDWLLETHILMIGGWILQFFGHWIEGNRPALLTGLIDSFVLAPVFSIGLL